MPAKSKAQQRLFGMVHRYQKEGGKASPQIKKLAKNISPKSVKDFASTSRKDLPGKIEERLDEILEEATRFKYPAAKWEAGEAHNIGITTPIELEDYPLPTFVPEIATAATRIQRWLEQTIQQKGHLRLTVKPAFWYNGELLPAEVAESNPGMQNIVQQNEPVYAIMAVDGHPLTKIAQAKLKISSGDVFQSDDQQEWLEDLRQTIGYLESEGDLELEEVSLPASASDYFALSTKHNPDVVLLFSPKYGKGLYILQREIELMADGRRWSDEYDAAMRSFFAAPDVYMKAIGVPISSTESRRRVLTWFRVYLEKTQQGAYVYRPSNELSDAIVDFAAGKTPQEIPNFAFN